MPTFKVRVSAPDVRDTSGNRRNVFVEAADAETAARLAAGMVGEGRVHDVTESKPHAKKSAARNARRRVAKKAKNSKKADNTKPTAAEIDAKKGDDPDPGFRVVK